MKILFFLLSITASFSALAQPGSVSKAISNDGRQLRIQVDIRYPDQTIHYNRSFDVAGMDRSAIAALERRVLDSLDVVALTPVLPNETTTDQPTNPAELARPTHMAAVSGVTPGSRIPYEETVEENLAEGRLKVRLTFRTDGQNNSVERSAMIRDKTEGGRQKLRRAVKQQLIAEMENVVSVSGA